MYYNKPNLISQDVEGEEYQASKGQREPDLLKTGAEFGFGKITPELPSETITIGRKRRFVTVT
jgi:hypothetical protein